jgi:CRISPR type IV-associated protein Csf2
MSECPGGFYGSSALVCNALAIVTTQKEPEQPIARQMQQYKIEGMLQLTSPLHVAAPGDRVIDLGSLYPSYGRADTAHMNLTGTTHCPLALSEDEMLSEGIDTARPNETSRERGIVYLPVFPANDARGRLRRVAAEELFRIVKSRGERLSLETYHGIICGAVTGQLNKESTFDLALQSGKHPFLGLFGGGPRMVNSSYQVQTFWPITSTTIKCRLVPAHYEDKKIPAVRLTRAMFYRRIDDALVFSNGQTELIVQEYSKGVANWIKELGSATTDTGEKARSSKQLHTFGAVEYVIPGVRFYSVIKVDIQRAGLGSLGLLIHTIAGFANKQGIGGWTRCGFGDFDSEYHLVTPDNIRVPMLTKTETGYEPNADAEQVAAALDAWAAASEQITAASLEGLYALPPEKKKKAAA